MRVLKLLIPMLFLLLVSACDEFSQTGSNLDVLNCINDNNFQETGIDESKINQICLEKYVSTLSMTFSGPPELKINCSKGYEDYKSCQVIFYGRNNSENFIITNVKISFEIDKELIIKEKSYSAGRWVLPDRAFTLNLFGFDNREDGKILSDEDFEKEYLKYEALFKVANVKIVEIKGLVLEIK